MGLLKRIVTNIVSAPAEIVEGIGDGLNRWAEGEKPPSKRPRPPREDS